MCKYIFKNIKNINWKTFGTEQCPHQPLNNILNTIFDSISLIYVSIIINWLELDNLVDIYINSVHIWTIFSFKCLSSKNYEKLWIILLLKDVADLIWNRKKITCFFTKHLHYRRMVGLTEDGTQAVWDCVLPLPRSVRLWCSTREDTSGNVGGLWPEAVINKP